MSVPIILASGSEIRAQLLARAGVDFSVETPRVDEDAIKEALVAEGAPPRDIADALAEAKARKVALTYGDGLVLGCDQVLDFEGSVLSKPETPGVAIEQLKTMRGKRHMLLSAAVIYDDGKPVWRHIGQVRLLMRNMSDGWLSAYVDRNWQSIRHSVGAYKLEEEGVRLFSRIEGDHFNVLGMPLLEILSYLTLRGTLSS
ncbi:MAG: nucleoside triphosphate pyrophosphatase [Paracoccaceae bacterium]|nr:nucleoside triphosphate pyrophosphatase [Paracoccaceae bacterium]